VPVLGEVVWELPADAPFYAYICRVSDGRQIGYARVPDYNYNKDAVNVFEKVIARFESTTAAMVLDQVNNPGGSMFHMYAILSTLTDKALALPQHEIIFGEDDVAIARETIATAEVGEAIPSDERPSPELVAYSRFVLSEIKAGRGTKGKVTNPVHLGGVVEILPAKNHYTKKIVVLINELSFSAAEFLAAILQDNKRATLFGQRTPGAGGCARRISWPNQFGIDYMTYTWTIARRTNGQRIENIGVHPDVSYSITVEDIRSGYAGYRKALLSTINAYINDHLR
jgi:C-terminal processing protease CtpA/Prc